jgi:hypothetical protein
MVAGVLWQAVTVLVENADCPGPPRSAVCRSHPTGIFIMLGGSLSHNHHDNRPWGQKGTLPYTLACTVKSGSGLASTPNVNRGEEEGKKLVVLPQLGCLATYIGYSSHVSTSLC